MPRRCSSYRRTGHWPTNSSRKFERSYAIPSRDRRITQAEFLCSEASRALIPDVDPHGATSILTDEVFAGVLGIVRLPGETAQEFLCNAVEFANDVLPGSLGA